MIFLALGLFIGVALGWFSYAYQGLFLGGLTVSGGVAALLFKQVIAPFAGIAAQGGVGDGGPISMIGAIFGQLPMDVQNAVYLAFISFFVARIATWLRAKTAKKAAPETAKERKERIFREYGYSGHS